MDSLATVFAFGPAIDTGSLLRAWVDRSPQNPPNGGPPKIPQGRSGGAQRTC